MSTDTTIKIKVHVSTKYVRSGDERVVDTGVTPQERDEMDEVTWNKLCDELAEQELWNMINWGWEEV